MAAEVERRIEVFGSEVRLLIGEPVSERVPSPEAIALQLEGFLRVLHARLTRFDPGSELCALNADPAAEREVSSILAAAVGAALWAARFSGGLVDPTLVGELERAGYSRSLANVEPEPLALALAAAPPRHPARARPEREWERISVDPDRGVVERPAGCRIDTGGTGKGLAADLCAERLLGYRSFAVDAGGDVRIGGVRPEPRRVLIDHPLGGGTAAEMSLAAGAVATSGLGTRLWRHRGAHRHHLLDPSTGAPAWTGVIQATAVGESALEAETIAKLALLSGPERARVLLSAAGGALVLDDGTVEAFGPVVTGRPRVEIAA